MSRAGAGRDAGAGGGRLGAWDAPPQVIFRLEKGIRELLVGFPCMLNIVWDFWIEFHKTTIGR